MLRKFVKNLDAPRGVMFLLRDWPLTANEALQDTPSFPTNSCPTAVSRII